MNDLPPDAPTAGATLEKPPAACESCKRPITDAYYKVNARRVCASCARTAKRTNEPVRALDYIGAFIYGAIAANFGAMIYSATTVVADFDLELIAWVCGFLVGGAVQVGASNKGGRQFQVMAVVLTYFAISLAQAPPAIEDIMEIAQTDRSRAAWALPDGTVGAIIWILKLPIWTVSTMPWGPLNAVLIGLGLRQAWKMTAARRKAIGGPYPVSPEGGEATPAAVRP